MGEWKTIDSAPKDGTRGAPLLGGYSGRALATARRDDETDGQYRIRMRRNEQQRVRMHRIPRTRKNNPIGDDVAAERQREYAKKWRAANLEKSRLSNREAQRRARERQWQVVLLRGCKARAKQSGLTFSLDLAWASENWTGYCAVTGAKFVFLPGGPNPLSASVDRIDNSRGYEPGNCRFVTAQFNAIKGTLADSRLFAIACQVVEYHNRRDALGFCA